ncbi:hypothetical protein CDAR_40731 [Caerostris darwini]|uniref:Uncharacterized protein n=1 Tax=Caerostris darwini TaxID=1538125 RepID=A0AAV4TA71_9ARAC|nr:hypothetical protein CDAR_40731 [Caerostris darwini]
MPVRKFIQDRYWMQQILQSALQRNPPKVSTASVRKLAPKLSKKHKIFMQAIFQEETEGIFFPEQLTFVQKHEEVKDGHLSQRMRNDRVAWLKMDLSQWIRTFNINDTVEGINIFPMIAQEVSARRS